MKVLFVCRGNVGRSQMAEAFFNYYTKKHFAVSAGYNADKYSDLVLGEELGWNVVECMREIGIDLAGKRPTQLNKELFDSVNRVFWLAEREMVPEYVNRNKVVFWDVEDPAHMDYRGHCVVRDYVEKLVKELIPNL